MTRERERKAQQERSDLRSQIMDICTTPEFLQELVNSVANAVTKVLENKINELSRELDQLNEDVTALEYKHDNLEQYSRRNNIRIYGIPRTTDENIEEIVLDLFNHKLNCKVNSNDMEICHRVGRNRDGKQAIFIKFFSYHIKQKYIH